MTKYITPERLIGFAEVAELLGVSKDTANGYRRRSSFPDPVAELKMGPLWDTVDVRRWKAANLRAGRDQRLELTCPWCGSDFIHMVAESPWSGVTHEDRPGLRATFTCEHCPHISHLLLYNHEGVTTIKLTTEREGPQ